jgi:hypothetical protein
VDAFTLGMAAEQPSNFAPRHHTVLLPSSYCPHVIHGVQALGHKVCRSLILFTLPQFGLYKLDSYFHRTSGEWTF